MATKIADLTEFLKGFLAGVWFGLTHPLLNRHDSDRELAKIIMKRRETAARDA